MAINDARVKAWVEAGKPQAGIGLPGLPPPGWMDIYNEFEKDVRKRNFEREWSARPHDPQVETVDIKAVNEAWDRRQVH